ncbi:MAG: tRNA uracil 4-sulfurtransferase ThiI [Nanoarchaeota archaeon]|nr:tRNA uracil 4-sulfurtransferase ThiI [Nanoarchaeota archaeon]
MKYTHIVVHYAEIAIKGKNRPFFERTLIENIVHAIKGLKAGRIKRQYGRIIIELTDESKTDLIISKLENIPGISSFSPGVKASHEIEDVNKKSLTLISNLQINSFAVKAKRSFKKFKLKSMELAKEVGSYIAQEIKKPVDLVSPDCRVFLEVVENGVYIYTKKISGIGGLPVRVSGKVMVLLSGGIDSPVASYLTLKRGCSNIYIHFHSEPHTNISSRLKVQELAKHLSRYQGETKIFMVPLIDIQKEVMLKTNKDYRIILYRRFMFKLAEMLARKENAKALVTGENLGQVASQTIENISVIHNSVSMPIIQPLITYDKQEIINLAEKIGTYEISIQPHDDCCSLFVPKHPATKSDLQSVLKEEEKLDVKNLIYNTLKKVEKINI